MAVGITLLSACGSSVDPDGGADAAVLDASADAPLFDPDAGPEPGEGTSCAFSVQCEGPRQICVDSQCVREERVPADTLIAGAWAELAGPALRSTRIYTSSPVDWDTLSMTTMGPVPLVGSQVPGGASPDLAILVNTSSVCALLVVGETVETIAAPALGGSCTVATRSEDGWTALANVNGDIDIVDPAARETVVRYTD